MSFLVSANEENGSSPGVASPTSVHSPTPEPQEDGQPSKESITQWVDVLNSEYLEIIHARMAIQHQLAEL